MENETDKIDDYRKDIKKLSNWIDKFPYHPLAKELKKLEQFNEAISLRARERDLLEELEDAEGLVVFLQKQVLKLEKQEAILKSWVKSQLKRIEAVDIENYNYQRRLNILALLLSKI
ncbi:hypothetical protein E6Q11_06450 [Candidatus Dojkabacteria bacterium]|uniref:Uncharacterized protein n=1 Tax=Candidatus Dojkabacteria bacterium TaxID=2099670 RepID=A0A5C7J376_9BACT|nr:MAG: hypothetical protein E6Q11_06450 [Candidatus Dojkabacteria bacterium]